MTLTDDDFDGIEYLKFELAYWFTIKDFTMLFSGDRDRLFAKRVVDTPFETNARYFPSDGSSLSDPNIYCTVVRNLVYLIMTHSDIVYVIHVASQFVTVPTTVYWVVVLHILQYLQGTQF
ncbi:uncharacterized protein LOC122011136 [Zingiber officinale]|uniref:uncharacterized protein LOC122011136 n=1 Tax=Zingiber officinale TaxID=94328 RepID=UPI001C4C085A|nr:uncharacterized protein LOC122011136 [Zingiber officinale]